MEILSPIVVVLLVQFGKYPSGIWWQPDAGISLVAALGAPIAAALLTYVGMRGWRRRTPRTERVREPFILYGLHHGLLAALLLGTEWVATVQDWTRDLPGLVDIVALLPWLAMRVAHGQVLWTLDQAGAHGGWTRRRAAGAQLQVTLLSLAPMLLINALRELVLWVPAWRGLLSAYEPLTALGSALLLTPFFFVVSPLVIRWILRAKPLPAGETRSRLLELSSRVKFGPSQILRWDTNGTIPNAFFIGLLPGLRYVVLTDAILERLRPADLDAVYAHEIGHGARRHLLCFMVVATAFGLWTTALAEHGQSFFLNLASGLGLSPKESSLVAEIGVYASLALMILGFILGAFGWISRRFETEADLFAVQALGAPAPIQHALEEIGLHLGILRRKGGLRHFGIGQRIGLMNRWLHEPEFRAQFNRLMKRVRWMIVIMFVLGLGVSALGWSKHWQTGQLLTSLNQARATRSPEALDTVLANAATLAETDEGYRVVHEALVDSALDMRAEWALESGDYSKAVELARKLGRSTDEVVQFNGERIRLVVEVLRGRPALETLRTLSWTLALWLRASRSFDRESIQETFSELYLADLAASRREQFVEVEWFARPRFERSELLTPLARVAAELEAGNAVKTSLISAAKAEAASFRHRGALFALAFPDFSFEGR